MRIFGVSVGNLPPYSLTFILPEDIAAETHPRKVKVSATVLGILKFLILSFQ